MSILETGLPAPFPSVSITPFARLTREVRRGRSRRRVLFTSVHDPLCILLDFTRARGTSPPPRSRSPFLSPIVYPGWAASSSFLLSFLSSVVERGRVETILISMFRSDVVESSRGQRFEKCVRRGPRRRERDREGSSGVLALMAGSVKHPLGHGPRVVYRATIYVDNFQMESDTRDSGQWGSVPLWPA